MFSVLVSSIVGILKPWNTESLLPAFNYLHCCLSLSPAHCTDRGEKLFCCLCLSVNILLTVLCPSVPPTLCSVGWLTEMRRSSWSMFHWGSKETVVTQNVFQSDFLTYSCRFCAVCELLTFSTKTSVSSLHFCVNMTHTEKFWQNCMINLHRNLFL